MDKIRRGFKVLLILIPGVCFATSHTQFWLGGGYDFSSQNLSIDTKLIPAALGLYTPPISRIPLSLDESGFFITFEAEQSFSPDFSSCIKALMSNTDKSFLSPYLSHQYGTIVEIYGKYHYNQFSYLLGYSFQQDNIKISIPSTHYKENNARLISAIAAGTETSINPNVRLSFTTLTTLPLFEEGQTPIAFQARYNARIALAYKIDNPQ